MRVKRLDVQGFTSFKDKTVIHFDSSITGIVGPNGCGKSNIVDAFFWVMGEQSYKHMRGSGSDDLIFNGSSKYSPLGMAEATLVMETDVPDADAAPAGATTRDIPVHLRSKEVSVTRRVYRSGEGEYFINGIPARLKDIQELFMDTGVGAKGYSVIEQGQIGKIVNSKPEERRLLIEEAAGIAKYKARKKESLRKMEATNANLSRLNDVISEIERNLGSLERQAQKARQYKKYKEELFDKEMTWGRRKNQVLRQRLEALQKEREALEQELVGLRAELQVAENAIESDRVNQLTDQKLAEELQARVQTMSDELTRQRSALDLSRRRQVDLATQVESLEAEKQELEVTIAEQQEVLATRDEEASESAQVFESIAERVREATERVSVARRAAEQTRRAVEDMRRELMSGIAAASDLTSRSASLMGRMESAQEQAQKLAQQVQQHEERLEAAREEAEKARTAFELVQVQREEAQAARKEQVRLVQDSEQNLRQLERTKDQATRTLTQIKSRLQSLEELEAAHEGFADGPKAALDWARESGRTEKLRAIADGFDVKQGFEGALEGWLEGKFESLVSDDASTALEALEKIQQDKQGRASIFVACREEKTDIDFATVKQRLEAAGFEVIGKLSENVSVNDRLGDHGHRIASAMLTQVCVVRAIAPVAAWLTDGSALEKLGGWAIVSMEGAALDRDGMLRGGSADNDRSAVLLARKRAIAELRDQVAEAEAALETAETAYTEAREKLEIARTRAEELQAEVQSLEVQRAALERDVHQSSRALRDAESQLELSQLEKQEMQEEAERAKVEREKTEERLREILSKRSDLDTTIGAKEAELTERENEVRAADEASQALRIEEASLRERAQSAKRELESGRAMLASRQHRLSEVTRILDRASHEREEHSGGDADLAARIEELTLSLADGRSELAMVKDRLEQSSAKLNSTLERIKHLHTTGDAKNNEVTRLSLEIEKQSGELNHLVLNLEEKYGPGCLERPVTSPIQEEMSEPVITTEMSAEEEAKLGEEVERLRERIRRLGEVNVMAIEEFEELKKRYDYLLTEKGDLEQSVENLQKAIEHINKTSEERFKKAFDAIADRFERLFPIIFGGGSAKLSLVYPEGSTDILDAGCDILASPPGKKVLNINALSGGEKALTAISLIFAIFMVKPSPFCLLDEVDAPLDDANIGKFNALLKEMSAKSQFILITHNKRTMELNDTLYGVTMEEPGVSKMVSIEMH